MTIKKHYATEAQKLKDKIKESKGTFPKKKSKKKEHKKREFIYSFALMDIDTRLYVAYGTSFKSEQKAFLQSLKMAEGLDIELDIIRLDKYYSCQKYVSLIGTKFKQVKFYLVPKKNATIEGPWEWKRMLRRLIDNPKEYLSGYFQRNQSESGISEDKERFGHKIPQRREDRIDTAVFCNVVWHNLFWLGG